MKQSITIGQLAKMTPERVLVYDASGVFKTTPVMHASGMFACSECGHIQRLENSICTACEAERFIVMSEPRSNRRKRKDTPLKHKKGVTTKITKSTYQ